MLESIHLLKVYRPLWVLAAWLCLLSAVIIPPPVAFAGGRTVEQDSDGDGKVDRIAHLDPSGTVTRLEVDADGDGHLETTQFYTEGVLVKVERDTDGDGKVDERHLLHDGKQTRQERLDATGRVIGAVTFDDLGRPARWERDTTGDGRMDTVHEYNAGKLRLITRDTTGDGRVNVWQSFENEKPVEQRVDRDGDGRLEQITRYGPDGLPEKSMHDLNRDGVMETVRFYKSGELVRQEVSRESNGHPRKITEYAGGLPTLEKEDTNGDGTFDVLLRLQRGVPVTREEDTDHDGRPDRFTEYDDAGRPLLVREANRTSHYKAGDLVSVEQQEKDRVILTQFKQGKPTLQTIDENKDGRPEQTITFDAQGRVAKAVRDTNGDGRLDTWQDYAGGEIAHTEQDRNHDGNVDSKTGYAGGKPVKTLLDNDHDGRFETTQRWDDPQWSMVMTVDANGDGRPEERYAYSNDVLRVKEIFDAHTGRPVLEEAYDQRGHITRSRETGKDGDASTLAWHFDAKGNAVEAEKDSDGDGRPDVWFYYENGRIARVTEDQNRDGKPDLWEIYNVSETLVSRSEDLDFDGKADIEKTF